METGEGDGEGLFVRLLWLTFVRDDGILLDPDPCPTEESLVGVPDLGTAKGGFWVGKELF